MKQEVAREWVKALKSGNYKQGHFRLSTGHHYCCLGVLCEILKVKYSGWTDIPDETVRELAALSIESCGNLAEKNDKGLSFNEIAQYINNNWKSL